MKAHLYFITIFCFLFSSCSEEKKVIDLTNLNGYWEIDQVITPSGSEKKFSFNAYVDYFKTTDSIGFRSKVKPQFGGKYKSNQQKIIYHINTKNDSVFITYTNAQKSWNDLVLEASPQQICLQNNLGNLYYYRPYIPIIIDEKN